MRSIGLLVLLLLSGCANLGGNYSQTGMLPLETTIIDRFDKELLESSGLAERDDQFWSINDGGNTAALYRWSKDQSLETLNLSGAANFDWEALAQNEKGLFILDCGNNRGDRPWMQQYFIPWTNFQSLEPVVHEINFRFGDTELRRARRNHDNDCEAAAWVEGRLWIFTKNWIDLHTRVYRIDADQENQQLNSFARLPVKGLITGADYNPQFRQLVLIGYGRGIGLLRPFVWFVPVDQHQPVWAGAKRYSLNKSGQWEAILWRDDKLFITREDSPLGGGALAEISVPAERLKQF